MYRVVLDNSRLLPLLHRFNMKLGFGEKTVEDVCSEHGVNSGFFLEIANAYLDESYTPGEDLISYPLEAVVHYITSTHSYYTQIALPAIEDKIGRLLKNSSLPDKEIRLLSNFFEDYKKDFLIHVSREEEEVLPYVLKLEKQDKSEFPDKDFLDFLNSYSIREFEQEHERLETSLEHLSELIIKYLPPFQDEQLCFRVLEDLASLVKDLVDHANMEDRVLVPRVVEIEERLKNRKGQA